MPGNNVPKGKQTGKVKEKWVDRLGNTIQSSDSDEVLFASAQDIVPAFESPPESKSYSKDEDKDQDGRDNEGEPPHRRNRREAVDKDKTAAPRGHGWGREGEVVQDVGIRADLRVDDN